MKRHIVTLTPLLLIALVFFPSLLGAREDSVADVVEKIGRAVVNIKTEEIVRKAGEAKTGDFLKEFLRQKGEEEEETVENVGSGVVLDPKGIIVTNEHLISKAATIKVKFTNRKEYEARVLAADSERDIALLKVNDEVDFPYLKPRKGDIRVGERTIVIGNPYGLSSSVTTGVVSAFRKNATINNRSYTNLIQTDAAINPGNSGGALLDGEGNLVGVVTAVYEEARGIGFAIPIDDVMSMVSEFLERAGRRPILGVFIEARDDGNHQYLYVNRIISGSPAQVRGIRVGDRIIELGGKKIREGMKVQNIFRKVALNNGDIKVERGRATFEISAEGSQDYLPTPLDQAMCGLRLSDIKGYPKMKYKLRDKRGVVVTKVFKGGIGERFGLRAGDVIIEINNAEVINKDSFQTLMAEGLRRNYILYQVKRGEDIFFLPIKLDTLL
jgi:serine protease Do